MRKQTKKSLKKACDILWALIIRSSNNGNCEICGKPAQNSHHVIGRIIFALRWDLRNGVNLCISCHMFGKDSAHNNPIFFINWFKSKRPDDYEYLLTKKEMVKTFNIFDYQQIYKNLKIVYDKINS